MCGNVRHLSLLHVQPSALASFEKFRQLHSIRLIRSQLNGIDTRGAKQPRGFLLRAGLALSKGSALPRIAGIDLNDLAGFGIVEDEAPERRQFQFVTIGDLHSHDIMSSVCLP